MADAADVRPKRKSAGSRMPEIMEALGKASPKLQKELDKVGTPDGRFAKVTHTTVDLEVECASLEEELYQLRLEAKKNELSEEVKALQADLHIAGAKVHKFVGGKTEISGILGGHVGLTRQVAPDAGGKKPEKGRKIKDYVWADTLESLDQSRTTIDLGDGVQLDFGARVKNSLSKVTPEMWTYASIGILKDMIDCKEVDMKDVLDYLKYMQDIARLSSKYVWGSILLYDYEYRTRHSEEGFRWGTPMQELREFQLVSKPNSATSKALRQIENPSMQTGNPRRPPRQRGPFTADGLEICRRYNYGNCFKEDNCRLAHACTVCHKPGHGSQQHFSYSSYQRPHQAPQNDVKQPDTRDTKNGYLSR